MDIRQLEVFCKVSELKSFSRAARALHLTQPTVSGHVQSLERFLNTRLFDRLGREVQPTRAGRLLYEHARRVLKAREEAVQALEGFLGVIHGELLIAASTIPGGTLLPPHIGRFKELYPDVRVSLTVLDSQKVIEGVKEGRYEMGMAGARTKDPRLLFRPFGHDELILVVCRDHPLAARSSISVGALEGIPLIVRESGSGTRAAAEEKLKALGLNLARCRVAAEMGDALAVRNAVKARVGASIVSRLAVEEDLRAGSIKELPIRGFRCIRE
ncbi:MAG: selenium metabolism-associated LysR family transcriptional regulator, partial [Nitrospinota bacterium]